MARFLTGKRDLYSTFLSKRSMRYIWQPNRTKHHTKYHYFSIEHALSTASSLLICALKFHIRYHISRNNLTLENVPVSMVKHYSRLPLYISQLLNPRY